MITRHHTNVSLASTQFVYYIHLAMSLWQSYHIGSLSLFRVRSSLNNDNHRKCVNKRLNVQTLINCLFLHFSNTNEKRMIVGHTDTWEKLAQNSHNIWHCKKKTHNYSEYGVVLWLILIQNSDHQMNAEWHSVVLLQSQRPIVRITINWFFIEWNTSQSTEYISKSIESVFIRAAM